MISVARALLALLFLFAIWIDASQPAQFPTETYLLLTVYALLSAAVAVVTWNNWWIDARLAAPAHIADVIIFTVLIFSTEGYTSPFFLFFVFLLLSAAIRWGWRETAITAAAVITFYLAAGAIASPSIDELEVQRFIIRSGHLVILSGLLIWFGIYQGGERTESSRGEPAAAAGPAESALIAAMSITNATQGRLLWTPAGQKESILVRAEAERITTTVGGSRLLRVGAEGRAFLYDLRKERAITRTKNGRFRFVAAGELLSEAEEAGLSEGLAVPLNSLAGTGELFVEGIPSLATDHLDLAAMLSSEVADQMRRQLLLEAVEERGESRARLSLSRDLHDSVVQFLAGATFRIEAVKRQARSGRDVSASLEELKQLMLQEQSDLRSFIGALRGGHDIALAELVAELDSLTEKLGKQWNIDCSFEADAPPMRIPIRLHLDAQQLVRETIANAVRHGGASSVRVSMGIEEDSLSLELSDDGRGFPSSMTEASSTDEAQPLSLRERISEAGGTLALATLPRGTSVMITLPISGGRR